MSLTIEASRILKKQMFGSGGENYFTVNNKKMHLPRGSLDFSEKPSAFPEILGKMQSIFP